MKVRYFFIFVFMQICLAQIVWAQDIPEMEVWWRAPKEEDFRDKLGTLGEGLTYLPNFKDGHDAILLRTYDGEIHTWLNRFPGDTENVFTWKAGYIKRGDFNGDGIVDYFDAVGNIYKGIQNGNTPDSTPLAKYTLYSEREVKVLDINNDGQDDIVGLTQSRFGSIIRGIFGGNDLNTLNNTSIERTGLLDTNRILMDIYKAQNGEMRFIVYYSDSYYKRGYELYRAKWETGGILPSLEKIDSIAYFNHPTFVTLYQSKKHKEKTYAFISEQIGGDFYKKNIYIFDLTDDRLSQVGKYRMDNTSDIRVFQHSLDGDDYEDFWVKKSKDLLWVFSGKNILDSIPILKKSFLLVGNVASIGDVSGDGISELVIAGRYLDDSSTFAIVKGMDLTVGVNQSEVNQDFSFKKSFPSPLTNDVATVEINTKKSADYTMSLFTVEGIKIAIVFKGFLEEGKHNIIVNIEHNKISSGTYFFKLESGGQSVTEKIVITR